MRWEELEVDECRANAGEQGRIDGVQLVERDLGNHVEYLNVERGRERPTDAWFNKHGLPSFEELRKLSLGVSARVLSYH